MSDTFSGPVLHLRAVLDENGIPWNAVKGYEDQATYVQPSEAIRDAGYTIWFGVAEAAWLPDAPEGVGFVWGHSFEYFDATPQEVVDRLRTLVPTILREA